MKVFIIFAISTCLFSNVFGDLAPFIKPKSNVIEGSYLITLKGNSRVTIDTHIKSVEELFTDRSLNKIQSIYRNLGKTYHAKLSESVLKKVRELSEVAYIEQNAQIKLQTIQSDAPWGISRISQRTFINNSTYTYDGDGSGVTVYVVDSGILLTHPEFEGRVKFGKRLVGDNDDDELAHGTHCAGTIGSKTYGIAKKVELIAVKIFNAGGHSSYDTAIEGIDWAVGDKRGKKGNVINLSISGPKFDTLNDAVEIAYQKGFVVVAAAGNNAKDACEYSPGSSPNVITVGSSDIKDTFSYFSNYGKCVDVIAPGHKILSTSNNGSTEIFSGTSMSAPHVAGLAAYYMSKESLTNEQVKDKIINSATKNAIKKPKGDTPNLLAYNSII